jgi:single-stranded-DNA-specific exonuclease
MKKNWDLLFKKGKTSKDADEIIQEVLKARNQKTKRQQENFLYPDYEKGLYDPFLLFEMDKAVKRILKAKKNKERVCVYGDYDADGVTSSVLLKDFFDQIGIKNFCYIPDKKTEGYGINKQAIDYIIKKKGNLIVTVDCGVSNKEEVNYAKRKGVDVVITDHHSLPEELPKALALINPKREENKYPFKDLAGVGVAFKLVQGLAEKVKDYDKQQLKWFLDLVAVGTIADCVPLLDENRVLAKFGLIVLGKTKRVGFEQLFQMARISNGDGDPLTGQQVAFQLSPRINAAGRMDHANIAYGLLGCTYDEQSRARELALRLEENNNERRKVTDKLIKEVEKKLVDKKGNFIMESSPDWEMGIVGLAAGRIADKYFCPTILLREEKDGHFKGSGRSIPAFNLVEALRKNKKLLERFGGHSQAAGLEIKKENWREFYDNMSKEIAKIPKASFEKKIKIDTEIKVCQAAEKLITKLSLFEPCGYENKKPKFLIRGATIDKKQLIGNGEKHLKIWLKEKSCSLEIIAFGRGDIFSELKTGGKVDVVIELEADFWSGKMKVQAILVDIDY